MDDSDCSRAKRHKFDKFGRSAALERLKNLKGKGSKNKYEMSDISNVYETIDEKEYSKKVHERQSEDWIVDDDGSGYVEDGRDIFDDDLDSKSIASTSRATKSSKKKKLSRMSGAAGGNIQNLVLNMPEKKTQKVNLEDDELLSELIGSIKEEKSTTKSFSYIDEEKIAAKAYMKSLSSPKLIKSNLKTNILKSKPPNLVQASNSDISLSEIQNLPKNIINEGIKIENITLNKKITNNIDVSNNMEVDPINDHFDDEFDVSGFDLEEAEEIGTDIKQEITEAELISGWETMQDGTNINIEQFIPLNTDELPCIMNAENQQIFRFYWLDAYEDYYKQPGIVFLFGKVYVENAKSYASCCVVVRNIERRIFFLPRPFHLEEDLKTETNNPVKIVDVYHEFNNKIAEQLNIKTFRSRKVTKKYAFDPEIPEQSDYLEVRYPASTESLHANKKGQTFSKIFGTQTSFLEILLLDRKIKGPCWLDIVNPTLAKSNYSYCKFELNCNSTSDLMVPSELQNTSPPPMTVVSLNFRTIVNPENKMSEIVMIGCLTHNNYIVGKKPPNPPFENHFCVFTKPSNQNFPLDLYDSLQDYKATKVQKCDSEKALLNYFITQFEKIDPDLIIGHDLIDYYFGLICSRIEQTRFNGWSRFGKLKRSKRPTKLTEIKELMIGHLVCDLKISAKELIKVRSYDLDTLFEQLLNIKDERLSAENVFKMFLNSASIIKLISLTMGDAAHITKIVYDLNVMPLALQITNIAGNVMSKTLLGGRSERNEFLLLHAFTEKGYISPDKILFKKKDKSNEIKSNRKKPAYTGGLVLEPKVGFYDTFILLMDFNSLYPSIIQEFNICFTTIPSNVDVEKELTHNMEQLGILPTEIKKLVESRREVKKLMGNSDLSPEVRMQYNIRQMALKLTANSMYGCLGFTYSRFYAKHLASLVTMKGRDILMSTRDLVHGMNLEVIYGDTDSIMINTNINDYDQVIKLGQNVKKNVNRCYRQLELEVDGVFKYMLLLKKKKYAAVTMSKDKNGKIVLKEEYKGLDIVRRDWSQLSSEVGKIVLNHILSEQTHDERIDNIEKNLNKVAKDLKENKVPLPLLVITKQLGRDPSTYNEKNILPHVYVALKHNEKGGKPLGTGDAVPYVICEDGTNAPATNRAYHVDELKESTSLKIDVNYYLSLQIHPVVSRLCEPLEGLDAVQIANMLGLDPKAYKKQYTSKLNVNSDITIAQNIGMMENDYRKVEPFIFKCPGCQKLNTITAPKVDYIPLTSCSNLECKIMPSDYTDYIGNWLKIQVRHLSEKYYNSDMICEDPMCPNITDRVPMKFFNSYPVCTMCNKGVMYAQYSEKDMYTQLKYFKHIFDLDKIEKDLPHMQQKVINAYKLLKEKANQYIKQCGYSMIQLTTIFEPSKTKDTVWVDEDSSDLENEEPVFENNYLENDPEGVV